MGGVGVGSINFRDNDTPALGENFSSFEANPTDRVTNQTPPEVLSRNAGNRFASSFLIHLRVPLCYVNLPYLARLAIQKRKGENKVET